MLMKNRAATINRNKMWNLACVSGSCFFKSETEESRDVHLISQIREVYWERIIKNYCSMQIQLTSVDLLFSDHMTQVRTRLTL